MAIPSWDEYFLSMLELVRKRSSDSQTQVGTILVENNRVISMGYNGWPSKVDNLPDVRPDKYKWMVHGEINAIVNCSNRPKKPVCYITGTPCNICLKAMWNFGVRKIISLNQPFASLTDDDYEVLVVLIENGLKFRVGEVKVSKKFEEWRKQIGMKIYTKNSTEEEKKKKVEQLKLIIGPKGID